MNYNLPTYQDIINFIFYNETNKIVQKNVSVLIQISFVYIFYMVYYVFFAEQSFMPTYDAIILLVLFVTWYGIKTYNIYYTRLFFTILVPLFNWTIFDNVSRNGLVGILWSFPVISALYFCFYKGTALLAVGITFIVTLIACVSALSTPDVMRVIITLLIVIFSFSVVFFNFYIQYEMLENKVQQDPLTKLFNRGVLKDMLVTSINQQQKGLQPVILCFDLDNFKYVNDTFGHSVGDTVLINTANLFTSEVKEKDKVFRLGGEEFLILVNDMRLQDASMLAEKIRQALETTDLIGNAHIVTSSIGVAVHQVDEEWSDWLKRADDAMYHAKKSGKNKVVVANNQSIP